MILSLSISSSQIESMLTILTHSNIQFDDDVNENDLSFFLSLSSFSLHVKIHEPDIFFSMTVKNNTHTHTHTQKRKRESTIFFCLLHFAAENNGDFLNHEDMLHHNVLNHIGYKLNRSFFARMSRDDSYILVSHRFEVNLSQM